MLYLHHLKGQIILAPPSAIKDVWSRKINNKVIGLASGWMAIKQRAKQKLIELPITSTVEGKSLISLFTKILNA